MWEYHLETGVPRKVFIKFKYKTWIDAAVHLNVQPYFFRCLHIKEEILNMNCVLLIFGVCFAGRPSFG